VTASPYGLAIETTALLVLWVALAVWQRDRKAAAGSWFVGLCLAVITWCFGEMLTQWNLVDDWTRDRVVFAGILAVPPLWVAVAAHATGISLARRVPRFPIALLAPSAVLYALLYAGPWSTAFLVSDGTVSTAGPLFPIWTTYSYALIVVGVAFFVTAARRWPRKGLWPRVIALAVGLLVPLVGNAVYVFGRFGWQDDPTPVLIGIAALPLRSAIFGSGFFDVLPVDQRNLFQDLPVGIVLADATGRVVALNRQAELCLGLSRRQAVGRSLEAVLAELSDDVSVRVAPVSGRWSRALCAVIGETDPRAAGERSRAA
jgi:PAS domain-containing protein